MRLPGAADEYQWQKNQQQQPSGRLLPLSGPRTIKLCRRQIAEETDFSFWFFSFGLRRRRVQQGGESTAAVCHTTTYSHTDAPRTYSAPPTETEGVYSVRALGRDDHHPLNERNERRRSAGKWTPGTTAPRTMLPTVCPVCHGSF